MDNSLPVRQSSNQCVNSSIAESGQRHRPGTHDPRNLYSVSKDYSFQLKKLPAEQLFAIWRLLLSKELHKGVGSLEDSEVNTLWLLYMKLSELKDPSFRYGIWNSRVGEALLNQFRWIVGILKFPPSSGRDHFVQTSGRQGYLASAWAFFGWEKEFKLEQILHRKNRRLKTKNPPPKRFVGVGYRDSGHRRDSAFEGSPHWKEVASHNWKQSKDFPPMQEHYLTSANAQFQEERIPSLSIVI